jgi:hypothetical protein
MTIASCRLDIERQKNNFRIRDGSLGGAVYRGFPFTAAFLKRTFGRDEPRFRALS